MKKAAASAGRELILIRKIIWSKTFEKRNPFGGKEGVRCLSLTFHSKVYEEAPADELEALEILYEISSANNIDVMSFDGKVYPKIVFRNPNNVGNIDVSILNSEGKFILFTGIDSYRIDKDHITWIMGSYSSDRQKEFDDARDEIIQAEAHLALRRDIFVTTSPFLLKNRDKLTDSNIHSPLEALKVVGLCIRYQNEHEWISERKDKVRLLASNHGFFEYLVRGLLPANWRFLRYIPPFLNAEDERYLGISVINRCSSAVQARDELARLFYMSGEYGSSDKRTYHFDYLTLLLTGALDTMALILNRVYSLDLHSLDCSFSQSRSKFKKKLMAKNSASQVLDLINSKHVASLLEILYGLRNKIHSASLEESMSIPQDNVDPLLDLIYNFDSVDHCGMTKQKVLAHINNNPPVLHFNIKIDKYLLASKLIDETFKLTNQIMDLVTPKEVNGDAPRESIQYIERYKLLG